MKESKLSLIFFLYFTIFVNTQTISSIDKSIYIKDILYSQKCYNDISKEKKENIIFEINNNSTSNKIFIQYKSVSKFVIYDSLTNDANLIHKESSNFGSYYLSLTPEKSKYYIKISYEDNSSYKICFFSFEGKGNTFQYENNKSGIKQANYELINSSRLKYYINNTNFEIRKFFFGLRFDSKILEKVERPKFEIEMKFDNGSDRNSVNYEITEFYSLNEYNYIPFFIPKNKYDEKFTELFVYVNIELKQNSINDEPIMFNLGLVGTEEIFCEFNINNEKNQKGNIFPKIYYININSNIWVYDRDILFLNNDRNNTYIKPFLTSYFNASNDNMVLIDKPFVDINQKFLKQNKYYNFGKFELLLIILDEKFNEATEDITLSTKFFGNYHDLIHYQDNITVNTFFNNESNHIILKMDHCRTNYFINYYSEYENRILDIESAIGNMNLFYSNKLSGINLDEYFGYVNQLSINNIKNSIISGSFNFLIASCPNLNPTMSYIYAHKKNSLEDTITFLNQKSLIYIDSTNQYTFNFDQKSETEEFDFKIKVLRTNSKKSYKLEITYSGQTLIISNQDEFKVLKHTKDSTSKITIKATISEEEKDKEFILEIFKSIDVPDNDIKYVSQEESGKIEMNKITVFIYDKKEINSESSNIEFYNEEEETNEIKICIHRGVGKYPFIIKPICQNKNEYIKIKPKEKFTITYNNPFELEKINVEDDNSQIVVSIMSDKNIKFNYTYQREIQLSENTYVNLNHIGNKTIKLSHSIHGKRSLYYQINIDENKDSNKMCYIFNEQKPFPIINDIYQEVSIKDIKSFFIKFSSEGNIQGKFKYFYGQSNLLNTIKDFSKEICLLKSNDGNNIIFKFETPFTGEIIVKIIFIEENEKIRGICNLNKFLSNNGRKGSKKFKIFEKKALVISKMEKNVEIFLSKNEIQDCLDKQIDIYILTKSIGNNMELLYDVKSQLLNMDKMENEDGHKHEKKNDNLICINCEFKKDIQLKDEQNNNSNNIDNKKNNVVREERKENEVSQKNEKDEEIEDNRNKPNEDVNRNINSQYNNNQNSQNNSNKKEQFINNKSSNEKADISSPINSRNENQNILDRNKLNDENNGNGYESKIEKEKISGNMNQDNTKKDNIGTEEKKIPKKKSSKFLYFIIFLLIMGGVYYYRKKRSQEGVNYSKISKYSYYDF